MKVINKKEDKTHVQWTEQFIKTILKKAKVQCQEVVIQSFSPDEHVSMSVDGKEYVIRYEKLHSIKRNPYTCVPIDMFQYTLREIVKDREGNSATKEVDYGLYQVEKGEVENEQEDN